MKQVFAVGVFVVLATLAFASLTLAEVVGIREIDPDGGEHMVGLDTNTGIVDINSELIFSLDRNVLRGEVGAISDFASPQLSSQINTVAELQSVVDRGTALLPRLAEALALAQQMSPKDVPPLLRGVNGEMGTLLRQITEAFPQGDSGARERISAAILAAAMKDRKGRRGRKMITRYEAAILQTGKEVKRMRLGLDQLAKSEGIYVQFGGWISTDTGTVPVHIPGFDNHPDAEPYEVQRWDFSLSSDERVELEGYQQFVTDYKEKEKSLGDLVWAQFRISVDADVELEACLAEIETIVGGLQDSQEVQATLEAAHSLGLLLDAVQDMAGSQNAAADGVAVLLELNETSLQITAGARTLLESLENTAESLPATAAATKQQVEEALENCRTSLAVLLDDDTNGIGRLYDLVRATRSVSSETLQFGKEVLKHDLGSVPTSARLALRNTGVREDGDMLSFKLAVGRGQKPVVTVQEIRLLMYRVEPFVVTSPVLLFVQPSQLNVFKPAPAYSMVLTKGSRSSRLHNQLWRPGLGINLSLLDFDNDDTMELGFAGVVTLLRDMVQVGAGVNLTRNESFWFLGLRLPMPSKTL